MEVVKGECEKRVWKDMEVVKGECEKRVWKDNYGGCEGRV